MAFGNHSLIRNAFVGAAMTAASAVTGLSGASPAMAQNVQVAAATPQKCVQPTDAEIKKDVSGKKTAGFAVCVLQKSIAEDQAAIARDQAIIDRNNIESECIDKATAAFKSGYFDKAKLRDFLGGKKPSEIGYCKIWNNRALLAASQG